jgi:hypothetical protein
MIGSVVFSVERSDKLTIFVKAEHEDFPTRGQMAAELLILPGKLEDALDLNALRGQVAGFLEVEPADEQLHQLLRAEETTMGGLLPNLTLSMASFAIRHSLGLPYKRSSLKVIIPSSELRPNPSNNLERLLAFRPEPLLPLDYQKVLDLPGISGEWFVGVVKGIVSHVITGLGEGISPRTGLTTQAGVQTSGFVTAFLLETGYTLVPASIRADVPLKDGDVVLLRGWVDREHMNLRVNAILRMSSLEMWSLV